MAQQHSPHPTAPAPVSEAQYRVLCCIDTEGGLIDIQGVPVLADALWGTEPITAADYESATLADLERGWIRLITEEDRQADAARWVDESHQALSENPYRVDSLDFTPEGWGIFIRLFQARHGDYGGWNVGSVQCLWGVPGRASLLSVSADTLSRELAAVRAGTDELTGDGLQARHSLGEVVGPYRIGPWWFNRFYRASVGYRLDIAFEPADMHQEVL